MTKLAALALAATALSVPAAAAPITLSATQVFAQPFGGEAEIPAYDRRFNRLFVSAPGALKYFDATTGAELGTIDYAATFAGSPNSVAINGTRLAVAVEAATKTDPGRVLVYDTRNLAKAPRVFTVGALPDQVTFTPDGSRILVANEGEPNDAYTVDPEGSVSIINIASNVVQTASFASFNASLNALRQSGVRIFGPNASVAQDLEPEYIAVSPDGTRALVTLQENNAVAVIDTLTATVTEIRTLGFKSYAPGQNTIDPNDQDPAGLNRGYVPRNLAGVYGLYQPDAIAAFTSNGQTFYVTANEGDQREYTGYTESARAGAAFAGSGFNRIERVNPGQLGADGPADAQLFVYGGRSFSILDQDGNRVFDSGNQFEDLIATSFLQNRDPGRDDNKGPEPEGVQIAVIDGRTIAFIGLERSNGGAVTPALGLILAYDITDFGLGVSPAYIGAISSAALSRPEGLTFFRRGQNYFLAAADERTNNLVLFRIALNGLAVPAPATLALFGLGALALATARRRR